MNKAVFLDRDGVINVDRGYTYRIEDFEFIDGVFEACEHFAASGYRLIVVTDQSGIGRGLYSEQEFLTLTEWMKGQFRSQGIALDAVYFCPHHPEQGQGGYKQCRDCQKPQPGMLLQGIAEFGLDPDRCVMFGDKVSDLEAAKAAGIGRKVLVGSQYDDTTNVPPLADQIWQSIAEAKKRF